MESDTNSIASSEHPETLHVPGTCSLQHFAPQVDSRKQAGDGHLCECCRLLRRYDTDELRPIARIGYAYFIATHGCLQCRQPHGKAGQLEDGSTSSHQDKCATCGQVFNSQYALGWHRRRTGHRNDVVKSGKVIAQKVLTAEIASLRDGEITSPDGSVKGKRKVANGAPDPTLKRPKEGHM